MESTIRILIADDHGVVREGLRAVLGSESDMEVVGEAATGKEVVERAAELKPDVILMDIQMPHVNGIEATRRILESNPNGVVAALGAMRERPDSTPLLQKIEVPTLVIGGEEDGISSPEVMGAMAEKIPNSRHVTLPRAGHLANLEAPGGFNAALREFLEEL